VKGHYSIKVKYSDSVLLLLFGMVLIEERGNDDDDDAILDRANPVLDCVEELATKLYSCTGRSSISSPEKNNSMARRNR